ncbi:uncharacterized protein LOC132607850 [Lycium barbarum]|uniref:uncharacterized protein LOC132607850 n=1 Tax=Lycium barbarum TaxID=112863 RepID=UPI00293F27DA|nr:uncharacterized protein LOC132607850 [Lycium barbarum]
MNVVLENLIDRSQSAFVPRRQISDKTILSHELVKGYSKKGIPARCILKVDLQKPYDSIECVYLEQVLVQLPFPDLLIKWTMISLTSLSYSINLNSYPTSPFAAKRGLRQGDPMSHYLFIIAMEYLNRLLKTLHSDGSFHFHPRCAKLKMIQLSFADDLLLFSKGDVFSVQDLSTSLEMLYLFWWGEAICTGSDT